MQIFKHRQKPCKTKVYSKAQTSFFVIAGLLMFIALILGLFVYNDTKTSRAKEEAKLADLSLQAEEIEKFANDCIRKTAFDGLQKLGQTGGYLEIPKIISFKGTGYWYLDEVNIQPFLNQTQERLLEYINENVPKCIDDSRINELGFSVEKGSIKTSIEFGSADVTVKINYPIKLTKEKFAKEFNNFFNAFDIRYRAVFEAATEVNEKLFDADFDAKNPLNKLEYLKGLDFDVAYKSPETGVMVFTVTDKKSILPTNEFYAFSFAAKLGTSDLKKFIDMQNNSATNPVFLPYTVYSVDKKAQLDMSSGTTVSLNGQSVGAISVQQTYPGEVTTKDVPVYKKNKEVIQKQDIVYVIDNPVYTFEPSGILFNKQQKLTLYYAPDADDSKGVGILMGKSGFWVPIPSKHEPPQKRVFSNILGFTEFTAVNCASQKLKTTIAEHFLEANAGCFISFGIMLIGITLFVASFFTGSFIVAETASGSIVAPASAFDAVTKTIALGGGTSVFTTSTSVAGYFTNFGAQLGSFFGVTNAVLATTIGIAFAGLSLAGTILGGTTDVFYGGSPDNCQTFYPLCDQDIMIEKKEKDGTGQCIPDKTARVAAGAPTQVCGQIEKCDMLNKFFCKPCSVKCSTQFY